MRLSVTHETRYRYSSPVVLSQQLLHLTPRVLPWQSCHAHQIDVEPTASEMTEREDYYGNRTASLVIAVPHGELVVRAASSVSVEPMSALRQGFSGERLRRRRPPGKRCVPA